MQHVACDDVVQRNPQMAAAAVCHRCCLRLSGSFGCPHQPYNHVLYGTTKPPMGYEREKSANVVSSDRNEARLLVTHCCWGGFGGFDCLLRPGPPSSRPERATCQTSSSPMLFGSAGESRVGLGPPCARARCPSTFVLKLLGASRSSLELPDGAEVMAVWLCFCDCHAMLHMMNVTKLDARAAYTDRSTVRTAAAVSVGRQDRAESAAGDVYCCRS